jgi:glucans biosynthesis protein C
MSKPTRISSMDALRALAMFLGVVLHAVMAYTLKPFERFYHDPYYSNSIFDGIFFYIHSFRMQLFYLIAGFFFRLLYLRIGERPFIKHRVQRILIPFIAGLIFILPFTYFPSVFYSVTNGGAHLNSADLRKIFFDSIAWRGPLHLWFLYYLLIFYVIGIALIKIRLRPPTVSPLVAVLLFTVLSFGTLMLFDTTYIQYSPGLIPKASYILYYGLFVYAGWYIHAHMDQWFPLLKRFGLAWLMIGTAACLLVYKFAYLPDADNNFMPSVTLIKCIETLATVLLVAGFLGVFLKWVNAELPVMRYLSDASYWVYLVHVALVDATQIWMGTTTLWGPLKCVICFALPTTISLITYQLFVRYTFIGFYLHGSRSRKTAPVLHPQAAPAT